MSTVNTLRPVISGTGLWHPESSISNQELVDSYNAWAEKFNLEHSREIEAGQLSTKPLSTAEFVEKASGIRSRYIYCKDGALAIERMRPNIKERADGELSQQAEMATLAAKAAMAAAGKEANEVDAVLVSCAYTQRSYPAIAIEVQNELGIKGFGFDMLVACSAATFGLHRAYEMVAAGTARCVLVINPELISPQINYMDRDSHFIFGDVATAAVVESAATAEQGKGFLIRGTKAVTQFSNNIRSNFGYLSYATDADPYGPDKLFHQEGRKVFKEVCPMAAAHITDHIEECGLEIPQIKRWFLHQANINMNTLIIRRILGRDARAGEAPSILGEFANTASAGSIVAFHLHHRDLISGDLALICSFGAGYSIGSLLIEKR